MNRKANFELFRIILMISILLYHVSMYNGFFLMPLSPNVALSLLLTTGGAIPADYAFIALSSYFFLEKKEGKVLYRFLKMAALALVLAVIKFSVLRGLFGYHNTDYFVDYFLIGGAWWFIYPYLIFSLFYPILNRLIERLQKCWLYVITLVMGVVFFWGSTSLETSFGMDLLCFLLVYFMMASLKTVNYERLGGIRLSKKVLFLFIAIGYVSILCVDVYLKLPMFHVSEEMHTYGMRYLAGRYDVVAVILGVAQLLLVRLIEVPSYNWIYKISHSTIYVFLLHETVLGVFWYFGKCWIHSVERPMFIYLGELVAFVGLSFLVAMLICYIYEHTIGKVLGGAIQFICKRINI